MRLIKKHPLTSLVFIVFFYTLFFGEGWAGTGIANKIDSISILIFIIVILFLAAFVWKNYYIKLEKTYISYAKKFRSMTSFRQLLMLVISSLLILTILFVGEVASTILLFGYEKLLSSGIPYPIYSFVVSRILLTGVIFNLIFYSVVQFLLLYIID